MADSASKRTIVVVGDLVIDHNLYEGERFHPAMLDRRGVRIVRKHGGAAGIHELLTLLARGEKGITVETALHVMAGDRQDTIHHAFATWRPHPRAPGDKTLVWRAKLLGYGEPDVTGLPPLPGSAEGGKSAPTRADVLVMDDAGRGFRMASRRASWFLGAEAPVSRWIVLKMTAPVARGDLWSELLGAHAGRLICLVSADDLRRGHAVINRGLSWERTVTDLRTALSHDPLLKHLGACRHIVVTLSRDGVLWIDNRGAGDIRATLVFDPSGAEGGWDSGREGKVAGYLSTMAASLAWTVAQADPGEGGVANLDLLPAIHAGLAAMRDLTSEGHGALCSKDDGGEIAPIGYPAERMAGALVQAPAKPMAVAKVPWTDAVGDEHWMVVESAQVPPGSVREASLLGLGRLMVTHGPKHVLRHYPHAVFRKLTVVDRQEIEALRAIQSLMEGYRDDATMRKPLSVGVFGPPGAGKSFGVKQLADQVFGPQAWLEFNLSQFAGPADLMGPLHRVRDRVLAGVTPVVFWDEFDSRENEWLQFLLAPMQDGSFQDGPLNHAIGKCVFVFAGGTSPTYAAYAPSETEDAYPTFRLRKGPDFVSRLDAYYDVVGPNRRKIYSRVKGRIESVVDAKDVSYPLRRALLIRNLLADVDHRRIEIDSDLLNALLLTKEYRHGSRSLEKLVLALRPDDGDAVRRSSLPPSTRLAMHVDVKDFLGILNRNVDYRIGSSIETLAGTIHAGYRKHAEAARQPVDPRLDREYADLELSDQEDNRAAARRTVDVLASVGLGVAPKGSDKALSKDELSAVLEEHMERLAEAEHDGWMSQRIASGWKLGKTRDFKERTHPSLTSYAGLVETDKEKDRAMVRDYGRRIRESDFCIVWLDGSEETMAPAASPEQDIDPPTT